MDVVRLRGEMNTGFAELRGEVKAIDEKMNRFYWVFALAIPVTVALTILVVGVAALVFEVIGMIG